MYNNVQVQPQPQSSETQPAYPNQYGQYPAGTPAGQAPDQGYYGQYSAPQGPGTPAPYPAQPYYPNQNGYGAYGEQNRYGGPFQPQKKSALPMIIGIVCVGLLLLCGGGSAVTYAIIKAQEKPVTPTPGPKPPVPCGSTIALCTPAPVPNQPTPVPCGSTIALCTPAPVPNQPTPVPNQPTPTSAPTTIFSDNFTDNSKGWRLGKNKYGDGIAEITNGALVLAENGTHIELVGIPTQELQDFSLQIDTRLIRGAGKDGVFIFFRNYHYLVLRSDGSYYLGILGDTSSKNIQLSAGQSGAFQGSGANNTILQAHGSEIRLIVNGSQLADVTDPAPANSTILLGVIHNSSEPLVAASFRSLVITQ